MRPESMSRFKGLGERFLADVETFRDNGGKVEGIYCTFAPTEQDLPANLCQLIKSGYGYAVNDTCLNFAA